jgi:hypothetical protein
VIDAPLKSDGLDGEISVTYPRFSDTGPITKPWATPGCSVKCRAPAAVYAPRK